MRLQLHGFTNILILLQVVYVGSSSSDSNAAGKWTKEVTTGLGSG